MKNELLKRFEASCPDAIKSTITTPEGFTIPVLGTLCDGGTHNIHPEALRMIQEEQYRPMLETTTSEVKYL